MNLISVVDVVVGVAAADAFGFVATNATEDDDFVVVTDDVVAISCYCC